MFNLVIFSVFLILNAEANELESENPAIHIDYNYNSKEIYKAWKGKPLQIIINNSYASEVWCSDSYFNSVQCKGEYKTFVPKTKLKIENVTILNITEVTAEMSTRWLCVVLQDYHGSINYKHENKDHTPKNLYFDLHVKGARSVNLTLNDRNLTYVSTNLSVSYDGAANYTYEDGEYVDFSCRRRDSDCLSSEIRLEYYNAEDIRLFETKSGFQREQIFRSVLKSKSDKSYLDCILNTTSPAREYRYRTTFYMKKRADATQQAIMLYVNGQDLPKFKNKNVEKTSDGYIFKYIDGEVLNVTCRKMDYSKRGTLNFYFERGNTQDVHTVVGNPEKEIILSNLSTAKIHNNTLIACDIKNTHVQKSNAILLFSSDIPDNGVRIRGLPRNNILYQYSNGINQWTIEYQYSVNDTLNLNCVSKYGIQTSSESRRLFQQSEEDEFEWKFEGQTIKSPAIRTSIESNIYLSNRTFTKILDATHDGKKIQCVHYFLNIYSNKSVEIILRLKPEVDSDGLASGSDTGKTLPDAHPSANPVKDNGSPLLIVGSSVGVGLVILGVVGIACWHRRSRNVQHIETPSADVTNKNDCPTPQITNECEYEYDYCHNEGIYYTEVDYSRCKQKAGEARTRNSKVYDEPYVHI